MIPEFFMLQKFMNILLWSSGGATILSFILSCINDRDPDKLANNTIEEPDYLGDLRGKGGLSISKEIRLNEKSNYEGICLIGPTGAYKTSTFFMNNLLENEVRGSFIVTDPKGELFEKTSGYQQKVCGRKVYKIDFINSSYSEKYNLLENCKTNADVIQLASTLLINGALSIELMTGKKTGGVEWIQMAEPLFSSVLLYTKNLKNPYNTVEFAVNLILSLSSENLEKLITGSGNIDAITQYNIFKQVGGADRTEGSIKITLATNTKLFTDRNVNRINGDTTFDIEKFRTEESILYISYPERKSSYLAPFIAPLFSQIIDRLLDNYNEESLPINLMFDEFGNIGMLNNMSVNAATVRSRKISLSICLQGISQLHNIYGDNNAKSILNNLKTKLLLPGVTDTDTLNYISNLCGSGEIITQSTTFKGNDKTVTESKTRRKLFEDGELRTLADKNILVLTNNKMPVLDTVIPYFESDKIKNVTEKVKYKKSIEYYYDPLREIERIKESMQKEVELDEYEERGTESRAASITRKIFAR